MDMTWQQRYASQSKIDDGYVTAVFAIRGHSNLGRSAATYRAAGNDLECTLKFLNWVREKRKQDEVYCNRREIKEERHLKVEQLLALGYTDRSAYLALSKNDWNVEKALGYLKKAYSKKEKKRMRLDKDRQDEKAATSSGKPQKSSKTECEQTPNTPEQTLTTSDELLDTLERDTLVNRATCKKVYLQCAGNMNTTVAALLEHRDATQQKIMRSEERRKAREHKESDLQKLMELTGYDRDKCEKILAYFGNSLEKAEKQYNKFQNKKKGGEQLHIEHEETSLLTDFRIEELEMTERRDLEQYFFSRDTLVELIKVMDTFDNPCCMVCPSVAHASHYLNRELTLLDIDDRFSYLPRYLNYNLYHPSPLTQTFDMILFDPPYFQIPMPDLVNSVDIVSHHNTDTTLIVAFLKRSELQLLKAFSKYDLHPTKYHPGYANVKASRRKNYLFYSNWDGLPNNKSIL